MASEDAAPPSAWRDTRESTEEALSAEPDVPVHLQVSIERSIDEEWPSPIPEAQVLEDTRKAIEAENQRAEELRKAAEAREAQEKQQDAEKPPTEK